MEKDSTLRFIDSQVAESERLSKLMWYYRINGKLIKRRKPCFIGDRIHIKSREGIFTVDNVNTNTIFLSTKTRVLTVEWWDFKCIASLPMQGNSVHAQLRRAKRNLINLEIIMLQELDRINEELKG
jgi:hypothetical protein